MRWLLLLALIFASASVYSATSSSRSHARAFGKRQQRQQFRARSRFSPMQPRHLRARRFNGAQAGPQGQPGQGSAAAGSGQAQGFTPQAPVYSAPTAGTKAERPGDGSWQPGFGAIAADHVTPTGGAGVGAGAPDKAPSGAGSSAGGNGITPNN